MHPLGPCVLCLKISRQRRHRPVGFHPNLVESDLVDWADSADSVESVDCQIPG